MKAEEFFDREKIIDISFFNFENAITAGYYANSELEIEKTNKNFAEFFPILGDVKGVYFPNVLRQLGIPEDQVTKFETDLLEKGKVLIPQIKIELE